MKERTSAADGDNRVLQHASLDAFLTSLMDDHDGQALLGAHERPDAFTDAACGLACARGMSLGPDAFRAVVAAPRSVDRWPSPGWLPTRAHGGATAGSPDPCFDWAWFGDAPLSAPFYDDDACRAGYRPLTRLLRPRTALTTLVDDAAHHATLPLAGLIFHLSRCGSTLLAGMLRAVAGTAVAAEPPPLDAVVQWAARADVSRDRGVAALRAVVSALGRRRVPSEARFFIKLDCWHALDLPLFRAAFPEVPWLFLYRDPLEVLMSHAARPGMQAVPGLLGQRLAEKAVGATATDHTARMLARIGDAVVAHWSLGGGLTVDYRSLGDAMTDAIPRHFGLALTPADRVAIAAATTDHAKYPGQRFAPDRDARYRAASATIRAAVATHLPAAQARLAALHRDQEQ